MPLHVFENPAKESSHSGEHVVGREKHCCRCLRFRSTHHVDKAQGMHHHPLYLPPTTTGTCASLKTNRHSFLGILLTISFSFSQKARFGSTALFTGLCWSICHNKINRTQLLRTCLSSRITYILKTSDAHQRIRGCIQTFGIYPPSLLSVRLQAVLAFLVFRFCFRSRDRTLDIPPFETNVVRPAHLVCCRLTLVTSVAVRSLHSQGTHILGRYPHKCFLVASVLA